MIISAIMARAKNGIIGKDNKLPWKLSSDLKKFKELTMGHHLLMGRKTFESFKAPLPGRVHLVLSSDFESREAEVKSFKQISQAIAYAKSCKENELFIIGGAQIYLATEPLWDRLYLSQIDCEIEGDTSYHPDLQKFQLVNEEHYPVDEKNQYPWRFQLWQRGQK